MNWHPLLIIIPIFLILDGVIVWVVFSGLRGQWRSLSARFPARATQGVSVRREFQSVKFGLYNLGCCVHLTADEACLHIEPGGFIRFVTAGGGTLSIPWEACEVISRGRRVSEVRIARERVMLPTWACDLAGSPQGSAD